VAGTGGGRFGSDRGGSALTDVLVIALKCNSNCRSTADSDFSQAPVSCQFAVASPPVR